MAGMVAVSWVALTNAVVAGMPLKSTDAPLTKFVPFTVIVNDGEPAAIEAGETDVMVKDGAESCAPSWLMVNVSHPAVMVSVRGPPLLGATEYATAPLPVPLVAPVRLTMPGLFEVAVHRQAKFEITTTNVPVPPALGTVTAFAPGGTTKGRNAPCTEVALKAYEQRTADAWLIV